MGAWAEVEDGFYCRPSSLFGSPPPRASHRASSLPVKPAAGPSRRRGGRTGSRLASCSSSPNRPLASCDWMYGVAPLGPQGLTCPPLREQSWSRGADS
ncbi:hypothetical protein EYF80_054308 [Liparis tanakae]|uniref:Uncharacterized protein n=1 Tax=Liparis tanakae TaxID=230148 RepID=A0A4Z2F431_9TELE|nr:hypothetical protein EYF80_054308 [Liparis tanakae]